LSNNCNNIKNNAQSIHGQEEKQKLKLEYRLEPKETSQEKIKESKETFQETIDDPEVLLINICNNNDLDQKEKRSIINLGKIDDNVSIKEEYNAKNSTKLIAEYEMSNNYKIEEQFLPTNNIVKKCENIKDCNNNYNDAVLFLQGTAFGVAISTFIYIFVSRTSN
jgi:hypothetical protein